MSVESMNANVATAAQTQAATSLQKPDAIQSSIQDLQVNSVSGQESQLTTEEVQDVVDKLNGLMQNGQHNLNFSVDEETDNVVVKVMDGETEEVIRQFPSEETLKLSKHLEGMLGLIFNDKA
ncbi:flagellar protein FlaG [Neptunomonas phycophila]|jgi:flagellar protein FlaG|uniref:flagellar protein FlaG n=1 Tax=Neptunomonas TaxID=75687 RepID=UPI000948DD2D|nr:flagellar protein FlaG [Neptunomonas phycophila]QLE96705.1 flagellar protein FlaG [Neptunomonas phycophila]